MRKKPESINRLMAKDTFKLTTFVQERFVQENVDDTKFAEIAQKELDIVCTQFNVASARAVLEIPPHRELARQAKKLSGLADLTRRVELLEARVSTYFCDGKTPCKKT